MRIPNCSLFEIRCSLTTLERPKWKEALPSSIWPTTIPLKRRPASKTRRTVLPPRYTLQNDSNVHNVQSAPSTVPSTSTSTNTSSSLQPYRASALTTRDTDFPICKPQLPVSANIHANRVRGEKSCAPTLDRFLLDGEDTQETKRDEDLDDDWDLIYAIDGEDRNGAKGLFCSLGVSLTDVVWLCSADPA